VLPNKFTQDLRSLLFRQKDEVNGVLEEFVTASNNLAITAKLAPTE